MVFLRFFGCFGVALCTVHAIDIGYVLDSVFGYEKNKSADTLMSISICLLLHCLWWKRVFAFFFRSDSFDLKWS